MLFSQRVNGAHNAGKHVGGGILGPVDGQRQVALGEQFELIEDGRLFGAGTVALGGVDRRRADDPDALLRQPLTPQVVGGDVISGQQQVGEVINDDPVLLLAWPG